MWILGLYFFNSSSKKAKGASPKPLGYSDTMKSWISMKLWKDNDINLQYFCNYILVVYKVSHIETYTLRTEKRLEKAFSFSFLFFFLHSFKLELGRITGKWHNKNFIQRSPGFPFGSTVGGEHFGWNGQKLHENYKIIGAKIAERTWETSQLFDSWGDPPPVSPNPHIRGNPGQYPVECSVSSVTSKPSQNGSRCVFEDSSAEVNMWEMNFVKAKVLG